LTRGRKPKPNALRLLEGNPGKRPINRRAPQPSGGTTCPAHLSALAKREWRRIYPHLELLGLVSPIDRAALAGYCQAYVRWVEAEAKVQDLVVTTGSTTNPYPIVNPYLAAANKALQQMREFLVEFGMTPASRSRVEVDVPPVPTKRTETHGKSKAARYFTSPAIPDTDA
jgi:P27 family predicted phage terminase small subunit